MGLEILKTDTMITRVVENRAGDLRHMGWALEGFGAWYPFDYIILSVISGFPSKLFLHLSYRRVTGTINFSQHGERAPSIISPSIPALVLCIVSYRVVKKQ